MGLFRGEKMAAPHSLFFHSFADFMFFTQFIKCFCLFCEILGIFAKFCIILSIFAHILCANFLGSNLCQCYFVSFFHLTKMRTSFIVLSARPRPRVMRMTGVSPFITLKRRRVSLSGFPSLRLTHYMLRAFRSWTVQCVSSCPFKRHAFRTTKYLINWKCTV